MGKHHHLEASDLLPQKGKQVLPIDAARDDIVRAVRDNNVVIVTGATGSGKSTQLPQILLQEKYSVAISQPRRIGAVSLAQRVAAEIGSDVGDTVGYCVRFDRRDENCEAVFFSDGVLIGELTQDPLLRRFDVVVVDEAHERSLQTDVLLGALRALSRVQKGRERPLKLVVTSATLDVAKFARFFGRVEEEEATEEETQRDVAVDEVDFDFDKLGAVQTRVVNEIPCIAVPGRQHPVSIEWLDRPTAFFVKSAVDTVLRIHRDTPASEHVLVFLTGREDIERATRMLTEAIDEIIAEEGDDALPDEVILPAHAALSAAQQSDIFRPAPPSVRKIVLATNIAETSLTVDGVVHVVDSGFAKQKRTDAATGMDVLDTVPIAQSQAVQRAGRAGRTRAGVCYRLFTQEAFAAMRATPQPEIQRSDLSATLLQLLTLGLVRGGSKAKSVPSVLDFAWLDAPTVGAMVSALKALLCVGAVDAHGDLTSAGKRLRNFPLSPFMASLLLEGARRSCLGEVLTVAAVTAAGDVFRARHDDDEEASELKIAKQRQLLTSRYGDHVSLLLIYEVWRDHCRAARDERKASSDFCRKFFLSERVLSSARRIRRQLAEIARKHLSRDADDVEMACSEDYWRLRRPHKVNTIKALRKALASSLVMRSARYTPDVGIPGVERRDDGKRRRCVFRLNAAHDIVAHIHANSTLADVAVVNDGDDAPQWVVFNSLVRPRSDAMAQMQTVSVVKYEWIRDRLRKVEGADLDALAHLREGSVAERLLEELRLEQRRRKKEAERIDARIAALRRQSESTDQSDKQSDKQPNEADDEEEEEQAQEHRQEDLDDQAAAQLALQRYRLRKRARHEAGLSL